MCSVWDVQKRFGRWDAILAEPPPPANLVLTTATWHAARAVAFAAKKDFMNAERNATPLTVVAILYLLITLPLTFLVRRLERSAAKAR